MAADRGVASEDGGYPQPARGSRMHSRVALAADTGPSAHECNGGSVGIGGYVPDGQGPPLPRAATAGGAAPAGVRGHDRQAGAYDQPDQVVGLVADLDDCPAVRLQAPADAPSADGQLNTNPGVGPAGVAIWHQDAVISHIPGTSRRWLGHKRAGERAHEISSADPRQPGTFHQHRTEASRVSSAARTL
jgi:hypothetical protein